MNEQKPEKPSAQWSAIDVAVWLEEAVLKKKSSAVVGYIREKEVDGKILRDNPSLLDEITKLDPSEAINVRKAIETLFEVEGLDF